MQSGYRFGTSEETGKPIVVIENFIGDKSINRRPCYIDEESAIFVHDKRIVLMKKTPEGPFKLFKTSEIEEPEIYEHLINFEMIPAYVFDPGIKRDVFSDYLNLIIVGGKPPENPIRWIKECERKYVHASKFEKKLKDF